MTRVDRTVLALLRAPTYTITVHAIEDLTKHCRRVHFRAPELLAEQEITPTFWLRMWIPADGDEYQRAYTVTQVRRSEGLFASDFVWHQPPGLATRWAYATAPEQDLRATVHTGKLFTAPEPPPTGYLLLGDPASLPAINDILRALPESVPARIVLERQHDDDDHLAVATREHDRLQWTTEEQSLLQLVDDVDADLTDWRAWVATEASTTRQLRNHLHKQRGLPKTAIKARGYWTHGKSMGRSPAEPSRDAGS